ncbi:MAG: hypothetical protein IT355_05885 [Gemmatimonadaceae bacterium]|nr:hypothetical protein [Gemmatimonadaceae bacterium]
MTPLRFAAVPESVPTGTLFHIGARPFRARCTHRGDRVWLGQDARFGEVVLLLTDDRRYVVAPWLESAAPRAMRELIRTGLLVPPDPLTMLDEPTQEHDAEDAALRVAVIEGLLETSQLSLDDAWPALRRWRALRDRVLHSD